MTYRQHMIESLRRSGLTSKMIRDVITVAETSAAVLCACGGNLDGEFSPPSPQLVQTWEEVKALPIARAIPGGN